MDEKSKGALGMSDKPRVFTVTRTKDNHQLGLSILIESLQPGETKEFVEAAPVLARIKELEAEIDRIEDTIIDLRKESELE